MRPSPGMTPTLTSKIAPKVESESRSTQKVDFNFIQNRFSYYSKIFYSSLVVDECQPSS